MLRGLDVDGDAVQLRPAVDDLLVARRVEPGGEVEDLLTSITGLRRTTFIGLTNEREASGPQ